MSALAERSSAGNLSSFSGVFQVSALSEEEKESLRELLFLHKSDDVDIERDLLTLSSLTSEVKAITSQAVILHGERIKRAQELLKGYEEGAFTKWLITTYGNRQTPYNFLQYYELQKQLPKLLVPKLEKFPRQAAYTLASREGCFETKKQIIEEYKGETKIELLDQIRKTFPLSKKDKRGQDLGLSICKGLQRISDFLEEKDVQFTPQQRKRAKELLKALREQIP